MTESGNMPSSDSLDTGSAASIAAFPQGEAPGSVDAGALVATDRIESRLVAVGTELTRAISGVIAAVPTSKTRPLALSHELKVNKDVAYRTIKASELADPIAAIHQMPGPGPLRKLVRGAARLGIDRDLVRRATEAIDRFEELINSEAGDRGMLDGILSGWLPEVREKTDLAAKQAAYRGLSHLVGAAAEVVFDAAILTPSRESPFLTDGVFIRGLLGMRLGRAGAKVVFANRLLCPPAGRPPSTTIDNKPITSLRDIIQREFSSSDLSATAPIFSSDHERLLLLPESLGRSGAIDVVTAEFNPSCVYHTAPPGKRGKSGAYSEVILPARRSVFDVFVHESIFEGRTPHAVVYNTSIDGLANINDASRDHSRLDLPLRVETLGAGVSSTRVSDIPRYTELLRSVMSTRGLNEKQFRHYRCQQDFPLYGSQLYLAWDVVGAG